MTKVLVLSGTAAAINYINTLALDPSLTLHVTDSNPYCPGLYAPGVIAHWIPRARDTVRYRASLDRLIADEGIDVVIPTSDYDVEGVVHYQNDGWSPSVAMFRPPFESFQLLSHKLKLMTHLATVIPGVVPTTCRSELESLALDMPLVVKPIGESGGKGVSIVHTRNDLTAAVQRIRGLFQDRFVIQQFIPGRTYVATLVYDAGGEMVVGVGMRSHRTFFTWGGGGCAGEMVDEPDMVFLSDAVVRACGGWRGPINFEWRKHASTGEWYLMEANCRLNGYSFLTTMNGVCLPRVVLALLTGAPLPAIPPPAERTRNFTLGFRETLVHDWVRAAPG